MEELFQKLISVNTDILMLTVLTFFFYRRANHQ